MNGKNTQDRGFTLVEILVVIVGISILAGLIIVAYNGVVERARLASAQSDMDSFARSAAMFRAENGVSPYTLPDFSQVLRTANLYDSTRTDAKSFAICATQDGYAFVAWNPIVNNYKNKGTLYLYSSGSGQDVYTLSNSSLSSVDKIEKLCNMVYPNYLLDVWTYNVP